jgi:hypothetical protein
MIGNSSTVRTKRIILKPSICSNGLIKIKPLAVFADVRAACVRVVDFVAAYLAVSLSPIKGGYSCIMLQGQYGQAAEVAHRVYSDWGRILIEMF